MSRSYVIQKRDTLQKIAKRFYNNPELYKKLAEYNGILNPDLIQVGQTIEIPSRRELEGAPQPPAPSGLIPPQGLAQIMATFGNIFDYIKDDGSLDSRWEAEQLSRAPLPFPIPLSWDHSKFVKNVYCHKKLITIFSELFAAIEKEGLKEQIRTFGGCFNYRSKRASGKLSTHCWGIAIDINPETNPMGKAGDMHPEIVEIFRELGFKWGGDWSGKNKDPMHFQFCSGY